MLVSLLALLFLPGCQSCIPLSDAERAAKEREEVHRQLNSSLLVLPYRGNEDGDPGQRAESAAHADMQK